MILTSVKFESVELLFTAPVSKSKTDFSKSDDTTSFNHSSQTYK